MKLAITTYATKSYLYALQTQMQLCVQSLQLVTFEKAIFIFVGDESIEVLAAFNQYAEQLKRINVDSKLITLDVECNENKDHNQESNIVIAKLQAAAWHEARLQDVDFCWSLEADILPQPKTLRTLIDTLNFDGGWYDVAMAAYPNAEFLGGRGTPKNWILPSVYDDEREIPEALQKRIKEKDERQKLLSESKQPPTDKDVAEWKAIDKAIKESPQKGNVYALNAMRWRQRGWLSSAYPAVGMGAILPTDWVGLGCTLMSKRALQLAHFTGYNGGGTQDLWLSWKAWNPAGIRMAVVPHVLCDHVKRRKDKDGKERLEVMHAEHEIWSEYHGHLRTNTHDWKGI